MTPRAIARHACQRERRELPAEVAEITTIEADSEMQQLAEMVDLNVLFREVDQYRDFFALAAEQVA